MSVASPSRTLLAFLALALASAAVAQQDDLAAIKDRCVVDQARVFTPMHLRQIYDVCKRLDRAGIAQIAVAAVTTTGDRSRSEYAVDLFKKWKLGHGKGRDDGLLILLTPSERGAGYGIKVEVGYGLEGVLPDGKVGALIDKHYMPHRQRGQPGTGALELVKGIAAVIAQDAAAGGDTAPTAESIKSGQRSARARRGAGTPINAGALGLAVLSMLGLLIALGTSASRRSFPGKGVGVLALVLIAGTIVGLATMTGAAAGWIAFVVGLVVNGITYGSIRSHKCPKDGSWLTIEQHVVEEPSYLSDGVAEVWERCTNSACGYERTFEKVLPRKEVTVVTTGGGYGHGGGYSGGGGGDHDDDSFSGGGGESGGGGAERD